MYWSTEADRALAAQIADMPRLTARELEGLRARTVAAWFAIEPELDRMAASAKPISDAEWPLPRGTYRDATGHLVKRR